MAVLCALIRTSAWLGNTVVTPEALGWDLGFAVEHGDSQPREVAERWGLVMTDHPKERRCLLHLELRFPGVHVHNLEGNRQSFLLPEERQVTRVIKCVVSLHPNHTDLQAKLTQCSRC